ncbi:MAG: glycosyltransferase family 4 protein, partial [Fibrobacterota bacterium]
MFKLPEKKTLNVVMEAIGMPEGAGGHKSFVRNISGRLALKKEIHFNLLTDRVNDRFIRNRNTPVINYKQSFSPLNFFRNKSGRQPIDEDMGSPDVFHAAFAMAPLPEKAKIVVTVHDMYFYKNPKGISSSVLKAFREAIIEADAITVTSDNTRLELFEELAVSRVKPVKVIYQACSPVFYRKPDTSLETPDNYILCVGKIQERKNYPNIFRGLREYIDETGDTVTCLLVTGQSPSKSSARLIAEFNLKDRVFFLGNVSQGQLHALYNRALFLMMPSLSEGFGMPILEAMASGCPVLTSDRSSMPEVAGDAALLVDPLSVSELKSGLKKLIENKNLRRSLISKGKKRAKEFSWDNAAEQLIEV